MYHPIFQYFHIGLLSLLHPSVETCELKPRVVVPGANYEIVVYAINPQSVVYVNRPAEIIQPYTFAAQWYCVDEDHAIASYTEAVIEIIRGDLNPIPSDTKCTWISRFGYSPNLTGLISIQDAYTLSNFSAELTRQ